MSGINSVDRFSDRVARAFGMWHRAKQVALPVNTSRRVTEDIYTRTLKFLTGRDFDNALAGQTWERIHDHWQALNEKLDRNVGFFVAALDYFENVDTQRQARYVFLEEDRLQALIDQSSLDGLTLLYNHWTFMMMLEKELDFARRKHSPLTLLMADVDNFKTINDRFGHQQGDKVLARVARILKQNLRTMDVAGRYGGEEFIVAFPDTDPVTAQDIAERIRVRIESTFEDEGITISMGMASYPDVEGHCQCLIKSADQALYQAKREGKNQLQRFCSR